MFSEEQTVNPSLRAAVERLTAQALVSAFRLILHLSQTTPWFLAGNGGMDPHDSPLWSPIVVPITHSPIPY